MGEKEEDASADDRLVSEEEAAEEVSMPQSLTDPPDPPDKLASNASENLTAPDKPASNASENLPDAREQAAMDNAKSIAKSIWNISQKYAGLIIEQGKKDAKSELLKAMNASEAAKALEDMQNETGNSNNGRGQGDGIDGGAGQGDGAANQNENVDAALTHAFR